MTFKKLNEIEWESGEYRIVKVDGLEGPVYEIYHQGDYMAEFSNFAVVKTYIALSQVKQGRAA